MKLDDKRIAILIKTRTRRWSCGFRTTACAADTLRHRIEEKLRWNCRVPHYLERATLE